ncbi:MAG: beta-lactamase family protein, partial [Lachnospiraceae bacterium]|nr:beta-lactamase family protein [Lachnospiraceae bacterium]
MKLTKVKNICIIGLCMALSALVLSGSVAVKAQGTDVFPSGLTVTETEKVIEQLIYSELHENTITVTGGAVRISTDGEPVYWEDFGHANLAEGIITDENTVFEWGNVSYLLVWVSVLQLAEQGLIDLDADITGYLPESELKEELSSENGITMMHLMNYSSGYHDTFSEKMVPEGTAYASLEETLTTNLPEQNYAPGNVVAASDWSTALAAYVVEYVSGMGYADYVKQNIFIPLGMEHTALLPDLSDNEAVKEARKEVCSYQNTVALVNNFYHIPLYPAGMVTGTADDLHTFANALLVQDESSKLFAKKETAASLFETTCFYAGTEEARIANGMFVYRLGVPVYGINGVSPTQTA